MKNRVRELRTDRGWTQERLGNAANLRQSTVSSVERGGNISLGHLVRLSRAFEVPIEGLIDEGLVRD